MQQQRFVVFNDMVGDQGHAGLNGRLDRSRLIQYPVIVIGWATEWVRHYLLLLYSTYSGVHEHFTIRTEDDFIRHNVIHER